MREIAHDPAWKNWLGGEPVFKGLGSGLRGDAVACVNMHSLHLLLGVRGDNPMGTQICSIRITLEAEVGT